MPLVLGAWPRPTQWKAQVGAFDLVEVVIKFLVVIKLLVLDGIPFLYWSIFLKSPIG
jgi:hypothetical protein